MDKKQQIEIIRAFARSEFGKEFDDKQCLDALKHINFLVQNGLPSTSETIKLGIKKKIFSDILLKPTDKDKRNGK